MLWHWLGTQTVPRLTVRPGERDVNYVWNICPFVILKKKKVYNLTLKIKTRWEEGPQYAGVPPTLVTFKKLDEMEEIWKTFKERKKDYGVVVTQVQEIGTDLCHRA